MHLGYAQYNLEERRRDFSDAFRQVVDHTLELKPDFMIIAGDLFDDPRPGNTILSFAVHQLKRLRDAGIPVLATNGSHDYSPNVFTGTILAPLDEAGLLYFLPRHEGACWQAEFCYVYGIRNFRTRLALDREIESYYKENPPSPTKPFNICVFHQSVSIPQVLPTSYAEMELRQLPKGFQYYAAGNVHKQVEIDIDGSKLTYPGPTETTSYIEADLRKGFYLVRVSSDGGVNVELRPVQTRDFVVLRPNFSGLDPAKIEEEASSMLRDHDEQERVVVLVLEGRLAKGFRSFDVDQSGIQSSASKALYVHVINRLEEAGLEEEILRPTKADLRARAEAFFFESLRESFGETRATSLSELFVDLLDNVKAGDIPSVKARMEEASRETL